VPPGTEVAIGELADDAAAAMLDRLAARPLLPDERKALIARAGGNPMFLRELAVSLAAGGEGELPDRVESLIEARIDRLETHDRAVLRAAAVVGDEFDEEEVAAALGEPVAAIVFDRLSGFITHDGRMRFRHALMRDSAYAGLPFRTRRAIHQRVGTHLEARPDADEIVERLAVHFAAAGDDRRTWRYGAAAGDRARGRFAYAEAASFYARALDARVDVELEERFRVIDSNAYCLQTFGNYPAALAAIAHGRKLVAQSRVHTARLELQNSTIHMVLGDLAAAERSATAGLRLTRGRPEASATHVRLLAQRSRVDEMARRLEFARSRALEAAEMAEALGDKAALAHALSVQFSAETSLRAPQRGATGRRARRLYVELNQHADAAVVLNLMGVDLERSGDLPRALDAYQDAERLQASAGLALHAAVSTFNRAYVLTMQGHVRDAITMLERAAGAFVASGYVVGRLNAAALSAELRSMSGDRDAPKAMAEVAAEWRALGMEGDALETELYLAEAYLRVRAMARARAVAPSVDAMEQSHMRPRCLRVAALLAKAPRSDTARDLLTRSIDEARDLELAYEAAVSRLLRARLFRDLGHEADDALADLDRMGVVRVPLLECVPTA